MNHNRQLTAQHIYYDVPLSAFRFFRTCQQLAAQDACQSKLRENEGQNVLNIYQKYYKQSSVRVTGGSLKKKKFKQWQYEAVQKRDSCLNSELSLGELIDWLEESMPNRKKKP